MFSRIGVFDTLAAVYLFEDWGSILCGCISLAFIQQLKTVVEGGKKEMSDWGRRGKRNVCVR